MVDIISQHELNKKRTFIPGAPFSLGHHSNHGNIAPKNLVLQSETFLSPTDTPALTILVQWRSGCSKQNKTKVLLAVTQHATTHVFGGHNRRCPTLRENLRFKNRKLFKLYTKGTLRLKVRYFTLVLKGIYVYNNIT